MSPITTHVLDLSRGRPGDRIAVVLERQAGERWEELGRGKTDNDGRVATLLPNGFALTAGIYRLRFATGDYFAALHLRGFYPEVQVQVQIDDPGQHYHVPLLLSPYGYSTYRGS
jgi:5-hydroxyisourate hydrolase